MTGHPAPSTRPPDDRAWRGLDWRERVALLLGRREPDDPDLARTVLAQARHLRERALLLAVTGGVAATAVWVALSLLLGGVDDIGGPLLALVFGAVFFGTYLTLARAQARRLERGARHGLQTSHDTHPHH